VANEEVTFNRLFGRRVARWRHERGLSQEALGSLVGLSRTSITNIEAGRQSVVAYTIQLLARHLEVSTDDLLARNEPSAGAHAVFPDITSPMERAFVGRALSNEEIVDDD
jgi:transcriptional regulator with XRE-family HTH domain